ncbi:MAG: hypothetical protein IKY66_02965 [Bacteroidales bacterium]|nr:hypothetical protein [Bacteroidales bacterium]
MFDKRAYIFIVSVVIMFITTVVSCTPEWKEEMTPVPSTNGQPTDREINADTRKVMLLYSDGCNSLSSYLKEDIEDLCTGWLPRQRRADDVILVYSHQPSARGQYSVPTSPVLFRLYTDYEGTTICDTLVVYEPGTISSSADQLNKVLSYVNENFTAKSYGMIFSSHATGYLPSGFYSKPKEYVFREEMTYSQGRGFRRALSPVPYVEIEQDPNLPAVKSVGQTVEGSVSYEMDIRDFAQAIPMKLDYILFDACLMGGIEVAYELSGKCDRIGFSQAEVLAEGFNYRTLTSHLLGNKSYSDPYSVCQDYFQQYDIQHGVYRSATISLVDCNRLGPLAEICSTLFAKYSQEIDIIEPSKVQQFYRSSKHWFYDMMSILENAGITIDEKTALMDALDKCVIYKGATPYFMNEFAIDTFCGFSMYLPCNGSSELNKYYRTLKWNKATGLVK